MLPSSIIDETLQQDSESGVTLQNLRIHLGLFDDNSMDDYLTGLLVTAETIASKFIGVPIATIGKKAFYQLTDLLHLPKSKISQISNIVVSLTNNDGNNTIIVPELIDNTGPELVIIKIPSQQTSILSYPLSLNYNETMLVNYKNDSLIQAVMMLVSDMFDNPRDSTGYAQHDVSVNSKRLLSQFRKFL